MKLGPVAKLDKKNKTATKKFEDSVMSGNCDVIVIFLICFQYGAIQKQNSGCIACKTCNFLNSLISNLLC